MAHIEHGNVNRWTDVMTDAGDKEWVPLADADAEVERLREALGRIAKDAEECPMEDLLSAGEIARKVLRWVT